MADEICSIWPENGPTITAKSFSQFLWISMWKKQLSALFTRAGTEMANS